jgi:hypothetical protein
MQHGTVFIYFYNTNKIGIIECVEAKEGILATATGSFL